MKTELSQLKFQSRSVAMFPERSGYALGSVEGRVAITHIDQKEQGSNFAFKCHRVQSDCYAVNAICFHQGFGTFATAGADGTFVFWDKDSKQRLKAFNAMDTSITATRFNKDGSLFAYAVSYDWGKGDHADKSKSNQIYLHVVKEDEIKKKPKPPAS